MKNDKGNPQTPALIQTYNFSLFFSALRTWFGDKIGCNSGRNQALQYIYKVQCSSLSESADGYCAASAADEEDRGSNPTRKKKEKNKLGDMGRNEEARRFRRVGLRKMGDIASGGSRKLRRNPI
eukprot:jgi/Botrbrau1/20089/Bobra.0525s0001.1